MKPSTSAMTHRSHTTARVESASDRSVTSSSHQESEDESSDEVSHFKFTDLYTAIGIY